MQQLTSNLDDAIVFFAKFVEKVIKEFPNPNQSKELELCDVNKEVVFISRKAEEEDGHLQFIKDRGIPVACVIHQKGDFELTPDTMDAFPQLDTRVLKNGTKSIKFYGKAVKYKSPIKINIVARSLFAAKSLSIYLVSILKSKRQISYPAYVIKDKVKIAHIKDYCKMRFTIPVSMPVSEEPLEEGYYRVGFEFSFTDSLLFFKDSNDVEKIKSYDTTFVLKVSTDDN